MRRSADGQARELVVERFVCRVCRELLQELLAQDGALRLVDCANAGAEEGID